MKKLWPIISVMIAFLLVVSVSGCSFGKTSPDSRTSMIQSVNPEPGTTIKANSKKQALAEKVKKEIAAFEEIYDVAVIAGKKDILVAYKVKHMKRFKMKKIEKAINKRLEKNYPDENFIVSSDFKIFIEALELRERMMNPSYTEEKAERQLKRIIKLKKAMA